MSRPIGALFRVPHGLSSAMLLPEITAWFDSLELMAQQALASGSPENNPRVPTAGEIVELYRRVWK